MASIRSKIAPFESVQILASKRLEIEAPEILVLNTFQIKTPEITDGHGVRDFGQVLIEEIRGSGLPVSSQVLSYPLLIPYKPVEPVQLPIDYEDRKSSSTMVPFQLFDLGAGGALELFYENQLQEFPSSLVDLGLLGDMDDVKVSKNLLRLINGPDRVSGMNYADRYWRTERIPGSRPNKPKNRKAGNEINPVDLHTINGVPLRKPRFLPTFWDLLFILLQPPLDIDAKQNSLLPFPLYPYQVVGVDFLCSNEHALLADDMGTGKTVMTLVALKVLFGQNAIHHALILCPPSVLYEWKKHLEIWTPEIIPMFVRGQQTIRELEWKANAHVYVTSYDTLRSDVENGLIPKDKLDYFDIMIIDEAHHIKNPATSRARAIKKLRPKRIWALTGTPIQNKLEDMITLYDFIYPGLLKPFDYTPQRVMEKVRPHFLRRRKQDVLKDLPPKVSQDMWLDMSEEQMREYRAAEQGIRQELEGLGEGLTKQHIFAKMQLLKRLCNFPLNKNVSPKTEFMKEQIEDIVSAGNKVIIFSQYVEDGVAKLEQVLKSYGVSVIKGGMSDSARRVAIEQFKNGTDFPILVASVRSAGEGLNLTEASYVIHFDHWWNPAVKWQAEDRAHRRGQRQTVNVYSYWMNETIDERIYNKLKEKGLLFSNIVDGMAVPKSEVAVDEMFSMDDLKEMLGLKVTQEVKKPSLDLSSIVQLDHDQIRQFMLECSPKEFEELVAHLMHYLGYPNVRAVGKAHDGGIDVESTKNTGQGIEKVVAQCKRYRKPVGVQVARDLLGAISDNPTIAKGYLVTTSEFTSDCITFCLHNNISMIDGLLMAGYVKKFGLATNQ